MTREDYGAEERMRIVLEGLHGDHSIAELCRIEGINQNLYYRWLKYFLEAGKKRLSGDTEREVNTTEVKGLRSEARQLKEVSIYRILKAERLITSPVFILMKAANKFQNPITAVN